MLQADDNQYRQNRTAFAAFAIFAVLTLGQNAFALMASWFSAEAMFVVLTAKDIFALGAMILLLLTAIGLRKGLNRYSIVLFGMVFIVAAFYPISPQADLRHARVLLNLPMMFLFGMAISNSLGVQAVKSFTIGILTIVAVTGYIELFVLFDGEESFWNALNFREYYIMREGSALNLAWNNVPGAFDTSDFEGLVGFAIRRMVSLFTLDPILFGHAMVLPFLYMASKRRSLGTLFFGIAIALTLSKGAVLAAALGFVLVETTVRPSKLKSWALYLSFAMAAAYLGLEVLSESGSVARHSEGLMGGFQSLVSHPLGRGIGTGGNLALRELRETYGTSQISFAEQGGESFLALTLVQLGVFGLAGYVWFLIVVWKIAPRRDDHWTAAIRAAAFGTLVAGIGSESPISWVGTGVLFALVPLAMAASHQYKTVIRSAKSLGRSSLVEGAA